MPPFWGVPLDHFVRIGVTLLWLCTLLSALLVWHGLSCFNSLYTYICLSRTDEHILSTVDVDGSMAEWLGCWTCNH